VIVDAIDPGEGRDLDEGTVETYRILIEKHLVPEIGAIKLKKFNANRVDHWLGGLTGRAQPPSCISSTAP
jgi:hypothetical protein